MIERTNQTKEDRPSKYIDQHQHGWTKFVPLAVMAYRSSIRSLTKYSPAIVVLGYPLSLPIDSINRALQTAIHVTTRDYVFTIIQKLQATHQLISNKNA